MKVEFIEKKEHQFISETWYHIEIDGNYLTGSSSQNRYKVEKLYFEIISNPDVLNPVKNVLHCAEFIVPSEDTKKQ